jgi:hypothetical protein
MDALLSTANALSGLLSTALVYTVNKGVPSASDGAETSETEAVTS